MTVKVLMDIKFVAGFCLYFVMSSAILLTLSLTVLLESVMAFTLSTTQGPHSISAIFILPGLISVCLCGFSLMAINSEDSKDASVVLCKSLPDIPNAFLMFDGLCTVSFSSLKSPYLCSWLLYF